jgi:hypothetical protein
MSTERQIELTSFSQPLYCQPVQSGGDNDDESLERDERCFNQMLQDLDPLLSVVTVERGTDCDRFVMNSRSRAYRTQINAWLEENVSTVRYSLIETTYVGYEKEQVQGASCTLRASRSTLAIEREIYREVCPHFCLAMNRLVHFVLLVACCAVLWRLVVL